MVPALFALSLVMIVGGIAAVVQGFPYVRLESGLAMVIGGSTAASSGVILLGLASVVLRLRRIERVLGERPATDAPAPIPAQDVAAPALGGMVPASEAPALAGLAGLGLGAVRPGGRGTEPVFEDPEPALAAEVPRSEPPLPDPFVPAPAMREEAAASELFDAPDPTPPAVLSADPAPAAEPIGLRPSLEEPSPSTERREEPEPAPLLQETPIAEVPAAVTPATAEAAPEPAERHAVGSYASGANTYVMFSDGSIEAETPRGRFTFGSLDELKSFINAGGEDARGAA